MAKQPVQPTFPKRQTEAEALEKFRQGAEEFTRKHTVSKAAARAMLVKEGIYTKAGKLNKNYRD